MSAETELPTEKKNTHKETATYHQAAFAAFNYLLRKYKHNGDVELKDNHKLSKEPLEIDIMVIKKKANVKITESWGQIFREHNIIEYKSPVDKPVSLDVFNKVIHGYTGIYASNNNLSLPQISTTIVCFKKPTKLFEQLKSELNYKILQKDKGIYYISINESVESMSLAIQFVVSSELDDSDLTLKALRSKIDEETAKKVLTLPIEDDKYDVSLSQWWKVMLLINGKKLAELLEKETDMRRQNEFFSVLEQKGLLTDFKQKWARQEMEKVARNMLDMGIDVNTIAKATGLFVDDILRL